MGAISGPDAFVRVAVEFVIAKSGQNLAYFCHMLVERAFAIYENIVHKI